MHGFYFIIVDNDGGDRKECRWVMVMTSLISCGGYCDMKQWWRRYDVQLLETLCRAMAHLQNSTAEPYKGIGLSEVDQWEPMIFR